MEEMLFKFLIEYVSFTGFWFLIFIISHHGDQEIHYFRVRMV